MGDIENLNIKRAHEANDCRLASVTDKLEEALEDSRDGRWTKCIMVFYSENDGVFKIKTRYAGCTALEARGLMLTEIKEDFNE